ncbi:DUF2268 domain-containing putative Zn-dependent protease [Oceanirhabdus sp. W0125-5]|uniref:DUF2268 domain-containing putative Zn-dependent protease n=1 Tax=Oceanirhabdus sp. W0125-5 TaxID=2999116 RepID=UPI0022F2FB06|nr:DUF2268 domain-containing putative Zn-dependent protease [Oceanirhabdus sp. W0125-5]WBW96010.1 DUF2268 domain-containing putative Zn-dependent protease [Oceanirhabdus sp. W0125-5]
MIKNKFRIISAWDNVEKFIHAAKSAKEENIQSLWDKYMIEPYWDKVMEWAPSGFEGRKPKPIKDLITLNKQLNIIKNSSIISYLEKEFTRICDNLPKNDEDIITIALYPLSPENSIATERHNGVIGSCEFGNILININPLAADWERWVPYVTAHEYHHSVWGHNNIVLKGNYRGDLLTYLLNEGQADAFAQNLYNELKPSWTTPIKKEKEMRMWSLMKKHLECCDPDIKSKLMFGDEQEDIPWCVGYLIGNHIIEHFIKKNPHTTFMELINMDSENILSESGYEKYIHSEIYN